MRFIQAAICGRLFKDNMIISLSAIRSVFIVILFSCSIAYSNSTPNVPIDDHVYRDIDKLISAGLIKDAIYGQRPWSQNEIARMIVGARRRLTKKASATSNGGDSDLVVTVGEILERLEREYHEELVEKKTVRIHLLQEASFDATLLDSPFRSVPEYNGLAKIKAEINPLVSYREGRHFVHGGALGLETAHWAQISNYFSFYARPRFYVLAPTAGSADGNAIAQQLYGKFTFRNLEVEAGRDSLVWGSGEHGGVLASNNARNLDMIKVSNDSPLIHPWIFKYLGPSKYTFFLADLGSGYVLKDAYLYGFAASVKPASFLEIGFEHQVTFGGDGAPGVSLKDLVSEFFFQRPLKYSQNLTDHRVGVNLRAEIPQLHRAVFYAEGIFEDLGRESTWPQFTQQMGFLSGLYFPLLKNDGSDDLRIEYEHIPASYGRHFLWISGLAEDDLLRGSELGPDGQAIHLSWGHLLPSGIQIKSEAHYENRDSDIYTTTPSSRGQPDKVIRVTDNTMEHRFRILASLDWEISDGVVFCPQIGYERAWNYSFNPAMHRNNFLGAISMKWLPGF
jgi:hypothetical protein